MGIVLPKHTFRQPENRIADRPRSAIRVIYSIRKALIGTRPPAG